MKSSFPDPYDSLPRELLLETFSFLQPLQISRSQRVCKSWREFVLSNSILHQVIYLRQRHGSILKKIIIPLRRQAALSKDRMVDVKLELQNLRWKVQKSGKSDLDEILEILVPSISTLRNLSISINEEKQRTRPLRFRKIQDKQVCASLQHLQLDLDSSFCEIRQGDSLWSLLTASRLKTLIVNDQGPISCGHNEEVIPLLSELMLFTILRKQSETLKILEIRNLELAEDGSLQTVEDEWGQISFLKLQTLELVGVAPSLLSFLSLTEAPELSTLKISNEIGQNYREETEEISLRDLGPLLKSASNCLKRIEFELVNSSADFDMEIRLPELEVLRLVGCYPGMKQDMMHIKCPRLKSWTMCDSGGMCDVDFGAQCIEPSDLYPFLQTSNSTLEEIYASGLYIDPDSIDEHSPSPEQSKKLLPFPNLVSLDLNLDLDDEFLEQYERPVLNYFPAQEIVEERARLIKGISDGESNYS